jgi:UDP-N-acetylglucosamine 2-epimerase (non-hydrolysing)
MQRIAVIMGTRPEAIKLAPVVIALSRAPGIECRVCLTGQHRRMLDQVIADFGIQVDADLAIMRRNQSLPDLTARALLALDGYLAKDRPELVLVQGDTTTAFCAALAAFYRNIPVGHVEAGLRTWDLGAPWPEEANRVLTTRLAVLHFAPTTWSRENLLREGVPRRRIHVTGNTVIDALLIALSSARKKPPAIPGLPAHLQPGTAAEADASRAARMILITGLRRESFGEGFENICQAIAELASRFPDVQFVYPVHLNPRVREPVTRLLGLSGRSPARGRRMTGGVGNLHLIEPLPYLAFVALMSRSHLILTDSGGIQEEAPALGIPVLVMREKTERPEGVRAGTVKLVGTGLETIVTQVSRLLTDRRAYVRMASRANPYGDGHAARRIARHCRAYLRRRGQAAAGQGPHRAGSNQSVGSTR